MSEASEPGQPRKPVFDLTRFIPYRLAVLADEVSETVAQVYVDRFDLSRHEWRILAWLGNQQEMPAKELARNASLDKMQMSRALAALQDKNLVAIKRNVQDRRSNILQLTRQGRAAYDKIVPFALAREEYLLSALTKEEAAALDAIIGKLSQQAISLKTRG